MNDLDICNGMSTTTDEIDWKFEKNVNDQRSLAERMPWNNAEQFIHDLDDVPIEQLALSARPHNALRRNRITTIGQVLQLTANKLIGLITMGERSASEVLVKLCQYPENRISIFNKPSEPVTSDDTIDWKHVKKVNDSCSLAERISWHCDLEQKLKLKNEAIEKLALSVRPYNALKRHGIITIGQVMRMPLSEIIGLPYLGETSATEIALSLNRYFRCRPIMDVPAQPHLAQTQQAGVRYIDVGRLSSTAPTAQTTRFADVPIEQLRISARAYNCLFRAGFKTLQPLLNIPKENRLEELKKIRNVGQGTAEELLALLEKLVDLRQTATEEVADNKVDLCHYIRIFNSDGTSCDWRLSNDVFRQLFEEHRSSIADMLGFVSSQNDAIQQITEYPQIDKLFFDDAFLASEFYQSVQSAINQYAKWEYGAQLQFWPVLNIISDKWTQFGLNPSDIRNWASNQRVWNEVFQRQAVRQSIKKCWKQAMQKYSFGMELEEMIALLPSFLETTDSPLDCITEMIDTGECVENGDRYEMKYANLSAYISTISDPQKGEMIRRRLRGETLGEIGSQFAITRERVRQIVEKELNNRKMPRLYEDRYAEFFMKYKLYREEGTFLFESPETYQYLLIRYPNGDVPLENALDDSILPVSFRARVRNAVFRDYINIDGLLIKKTRADIVDYVVRIYCKENTKFEDFIILFNAFCSDNMLSMDEFGFDERTCSNKLSVSGDSLWKYPGTIRYYPISEYDFSDLLEELSLSSYRDIEISTAIFVRKYPETMRQYDIHDEYELHNLLKKISEKYGLSCRFSRMPILQFGDFNRDEQVKDLLWELSPISGENLAIAYEERYGVKAGTVMANFFHCVEMYYYQGIFKTDSAPLLDDQVITMCSILTLDCYAIGSIKQLYRREYPLRPTSDINPYSLRQLAFRPYSGYVISDRFHDAREYFCYLLNRSNVFSIKDLPLAAQTAPLFLNILSDQKHDYEILEYEPGQYISLRQVESIGVLRTDLLDYCNQVYEFCSDFSFFSIRYVRSHGFVHMLDTLGFEDWFYAGILMLDERFSSQRMAGVRILACGKRKFTRSDILYDIVERYGAMETETFIGVLQTDYGIAVDRENIVQLLNESMLYYDRIMDKAYLDYDQYFEEV